jgi:hypothetical protein
MPFVTPGAAAPGCEFPRAETAHVTIMEVVTVLFGKGMIARDVPMAIRPQECPRFMMRVPGGLQPARVRWAMATDPRIMMCIRPAAGSIRLAIPRPCHHRIASERAGRLGNWMAGRLTSRVPGVTARLPRHARAFASPAVMGHAVMGHAVMGHASIAGLCR